MTEAPPIALKPAPGIADQAIFIHGISMRSGTNYLRWLLGCHQQVEASPRQVWEFPHFPGAPALVNYANQLLRSPKVKGIDRSEILAALGSGLLGLFHEGLGADTRLLLKEPSVNGIEHFFDFFPSAHLILLVRDGRDVAGSLARTRFGKLKASRLRSWSARVGLLPPLVCDYAKKWRLASETIARVSAQDGPWRHQCTVVKYEDLIDDLDACASMLMQRLGLAPAKFDYDAARNLRIKGSSFVGTENPDEGLNWSGVEQATVEFKPVGRWRQWPARDLRAFNSIAGRELSRWGYLLDA